MLCDFVAVDLQSVRIRDPWHGWEITVRADAFTALFLDKYPTNKYTAFFEQVVEF